MDDIKNLETTKTNETISINPANGEVIGRTKEDNIQTLQAAVIRARIAQKEWASFSFDKRKEYLLKIRDFIVENADEISEVISKDNGKTRTDAISTEVLSSAMAINYYAKKAKIILKRKHLKAGSILTINKRSYVDRVPYGVIGIISPWNYPFAIPFHEIAMALIAGNAVLLKTATQTLEVGKIITRAVNSANLPDGLFTFLNIPGSIAGDAFIDSGIDKLFFTGSVAVGKKLTLKASEKLLPLSLELGGNDAMIVCKDADVIRAANGALWAGLSNAGQSCAGIERIYVEQEIYSDFIALLKHKLKRLRVGQDVDYNVEIGAITTKQQLETVKLHLQDAIEKGASITSCDVDETTINKGQLHPPVIIENVNDEMLTMKDETFGPLLAVEKVSSIEEAITKANNSYLGLTASVWTKDSKKGKEIASKLQAGAVMINDHLMSHGLAETPWGGFKLSGTGRTHGYLGLEGMTQPRVVINDILPGVKRNMWWYPHNKTVYDGLKGAMHFLYGKDFFTKVSGLSKLVKVFLRSFYDEKL
jgi:succinate-semialdehyde dehydrogenase/glutarate-semialdehyde dehydrogenase